MPLFLFLCCGISTECEHMVFTTSIVCSTTTHTSAGGDPYFSAFGYLSFSWMGQCDKVVFKISEQRYFIFSFGNLWRYCIAVLHPEVKRVPQMQRNTFRLLVSFLCYKIRISLNLGIALFHSKGDCDKVLSRIPEQKHFVFLFRNRWECYITVPNP